MTRLGSGIWLIELNRGIPTSLTLTGGGAAVWSPDGGRVAFTSGAPPNIFIADTNEPGHGERFTNTRNTQTDLSWSPDGRLLL